MSIQWPSKDKVKAGSKARLSQTIIIYIYFEGEGEVRGVMLVVIGNLFCYISIDKLDLQIELEGVKL